MKPGKFFAVALLTMFTLITLSEQTLLAQVTLPRPSPKASLTQTVGLTEVTITYSRPGVRGREIWGKLVPYNEVWRTGANEATTVSFGDDVLIEGQPLAKGNYSIHTIPTTGAWTVIFNKVADQWGSYSYKPEEDALRVQVQPQNVPFVERMQFTIDDMTDTTAIVAMSWEKMRVAFKMQVNTTGKFMKTAQTALSPRQLFYAAQYAYQNNTNPEQAGKWLDASILLEENYQNLSYKANLLAKEGKIKEAVKYGEKAVAIGKAATRTPADLATFEKQVLDWKKSKK